MLQDIWDLVFVSVPIAFKRCLIDFIALAGYLFFYTMERNLGVTTYQQCSEINENPPKGSRAHEQIVLSLSVSDTMCVSAQGIGGDETRVATQLAHTPT